MAAVALDADLIIAFLDAADDQHQRAIDELRPKLGAGDQIIVAASVYAEVMVRAMQRGTDGKVDEFLDAIGATIMSIDRGVARRTARLHRPAHLYALSIHLDA